MNIQFTTPGKLFLNFDKLNKRGLGDSLSVLEIREKYENRREREKKKKKKKDS